MNPDWSSLSSSRAGYGGARANSASNSGIVGGFKAAVN